jgi:lipopolysaccharide heptosyltransferase II
MEAKLRQHVITTLCYLLRLPFALFNCIQRLFSRKAWNNPRTIVVIKPCCLGDLIMTTPLLEVLRNAYPDARIMYVAGSWSKVVPEHVPVVNEVIDCGSVGIPGRYSLKDYMKFAGKLRKYQFDLAFALDRSPMLTLLPCLAGIPRRVGPDSLARGFSLTDRIVVSPNDLHHQAEISLDLARKLHLPIHDPHMHFVPTEAERQTVHPTQTQRLRIAIFPGGGSNPGMELTAKRWPLERYRELTEKLIRDLQAEILLIGGPDDSALNAALLAGIDVPDNAVVNISGMTTIGELAAQLEQCDLFIGNDSSPMHLAAAVNIPVIAIFGPTSPAEYGPYPLDDPRHIALWRNPNARPCFILGKMQTCSNCTCMHSVTVDDVWNAVQRLQAFRQAHKPLPDMPRILLVRPDHLGDLVLTTPIFAALKASLPNAHITLMVGPWSSEVVARHPDIDRIIPCQFPGFTRAPQKPLAPYIMLWSVARQLRRQKYDIAVNLRPDFWWGAALLYLAGIPRRIGYAIDPGKPFLTRALPFPQPEHATISNLLLASATLETLGAASLPEPFTPENYPLRFTSTPEEEIWVTERLSKANIDMDTPIVVMHPGTGAAVKLWRTEAWVAIANALPGILTTTAPARIILTGSYSERTMLAEIAQGMQAKPLIITDATVGQLAALLRRACLVLGTDTGPLHLAVAEGTPTIHIFGPTDPRIFGPWGNAEHHIVVAATQCCPGCPYIPCGRLDFRPQELAVHPCTKLVSERQVEAAIQSIWSQQKKKTENIR